MPNEEGGGKKSKAGPKKTPKTKPLPITVAPEFVEWFEKQPKGKPGDKGASPPDAPQDQKEPREHGSKEQQDGGGR